MTDIGTNPTDLARMTGQLTPEEIAPMKMTTTIYPTTDEHGDRFERMWLAYHHRPLTRASVWSMMMLAGIAGVAAAAWVAL